MYSVYCGQCAVRTRSYARATVLACQLANVVGGVAVVQAKDGHVEFRAAPTGGSLDAGDDYEIRGRACGPAKHVAQMRQRDPGDQGRENPGGNPGASNATKALAADKSNAPGQQ